MPFTTTKRNLTHALVAKKLEMKPMSYALSHRWLEEWLR
jgi:hypothetical protein